MTTGSEPHGTHAEELRLATQRILESLPQREAMVLRLRFGLDLVNERYPRQAIANAMGCSVSTVARLERGALRRLRHPSSVSKIRTFIDEDEDSPASISPVIEQIHKLTPDLIRHLQTTEADIDKIKWDVFEHLVAEFLKQRGCRDVRLVGQCSETSADIYAFNIDDALGVPIRYFIQVKRRNENVGIEVINEVAGATLLERPRHGWTASMIVSVADFTNFRNYTPGSLSLLGVQLKRKEDLLDWLKNYKPNRQGLWLPNPERTMPTGK